MPRPSFFVVGAPKCGTTSLCHYLGQHPEVFIPNRKELHYFGSDLDLPRYCASQDEYLEIFADTTKPHAGEGTTWYLYSSIASREIHDLAPRAKIIVAVRNPTDMVYSLFRYRRYVGTEKLKSLAQVLDREKKYVSISSGTVKINTYYIYSRAAMYYEQIKKYIETFGRANVHVVFFEDLAENPAEAYRTILQFLGVNDDFQPEFRNVNKTGRYRSERFHELITRLPPPAQRLAYAVPQRIRRRTFWTLHRLNTSFAPPPPLDAELQHRLSSDFRPDVERLSGLIGRDLTHWLAE